MRNELSYPDRRQLLKWGAGAVLVSALPMPAYATPEEMVAARDVLFEGRPINEGRVSMKLPPISENGYSVPLSISVDSPMTPDDYVKQIAVFSPKNPLPDIARFHLGPHSGRAEVSTRIRLAGTQKLQAVAEMSDGSLWAGTAETVVTLAACVIL